MESSILVDTKLPHVIYPVKALSASHCFNFSSFMKHQVQIFKKVMLVVWH